MKKTNYKVCLMATTALLLGGGLLVNSPTYAAEKKPVPDTLSTVPFQDLKDTDSILVMPTGIYLHGKATILNKENSKVMATYDSDQPLSAENDGIKKMTVAEARQEIKKNTGISVPLFSSTRTNRPPGQDDIVGINPGSSIWENISIGANWQFSRSYFASWPTSSGAYLLWKAHIDDGRIADMDDSVRQYNDQAGAYGELIKASSPAAYYRGDSWFEMAFNSYNPLSGTSYQASNK
ncbi:hypothetical protein VNN41_11100 (plasmid) [Lactococcus garvieae]|uniref:hypothetical protein n=1 Tax=Lactococcus garvieae TaxID=1363 RepID=UPI00311AF7F8